MPRADHPPDDKFRTAVEVLNEARRRLLENMADRVLELADEFVEGGFRINEFLETDGTRLHLITLVISQFELMAEAIRPCGSEVDEEPDSQAEPDSDESFVMEDEPDAMRRGAETADRPRRSSRAKPKPKPGSTAKAKPPVDDECAPSHGEEANND